jgi:hypothetical protein
MAQELCFMSNVSAEVWANIAQSVVASVAIFAGAMAIRWQVRTQAEREVNRERAAIRAKLNSFCQVGRQAYDRVWTAFMHLDTAERAAHWVKVEDIYSDREIILTALRSVKTEVLPEAGQVLAALATIHGYEACQTQLNYPRAVGGLLEPQVLVNVAGEVSKLLLIIDQNLSQLEKSRDALTL